MDIQSPCRNLARVRLKSLHEFLTAHPDLFSKLPEATHDAYVKICGYIAHLKSRKSTDFFIRTWKDVVALKGNPFKDLILRRAIMLSACNWALAHPFFTVVGQVPRDEDSIEQWTLMALALADWDVEVAVAFLDRTPQALDVLGPERLFAWGEQGLEAVRMERRLHKAAKAYLEEAVSDRCATPFARWEFLITQAARIAETSSSAAEAFIRLGSKVCMLLDDEETERWVTDGLSECRTEEGLIGYFNGTSLKALEKRNDLASGVALENHSKTLSLICEAYLGRPVKIRSNAPLVGVRGFSGGPATDGRVIYLPEVLPSFELYKLMALHQTSLIAWEGWQDSPIMGVNDAIRTHSDADGNLLERLPALLPEMKRLAEGELPSSYPSRVPTGYRRMLPWWGDLLPHLVEETEATVHRLLLKAEEETDLPPEIIEALLSYMIAEGHRDDKGLWERLQEVFDNLEFASPNPEELQENFKTFFYKEWDENLFDYKMDWCLVRQRMAKDDPNAFAEEVRQRLQGLITLIRRQFMRLKPESFRRLRAQEMGDDLDLEALIPAIVEMVSGSYLSDAVYIRRDKRTRDVAVLFLVDMSASTEEQVGGRRVIDIQKEAMVLMAEALDSLGDPFAILGFTSEGRFRVDLFSVKDFGETYGDRVRYRLGSLEPKDFTRLGTVIRHAIHKLENVQALIKLLVILTDGRPYDLEYGTLGYAISDTRKALQEARQQRIHPFIITSDQKGSDYMKRICPQTGSIIVPRVEQLPFVLPAMYKRITT